MKFLSGLGYLKLSKENVPITKNTPLNLSCPAPITAVQSNAKIPIRNLCQLTTLAAVSGEVLSSPLLAEMLTTALLQHQARRVASDSASPASTFLNTSACSNFGW